MSLKGTKSNPMSKKNKPILYTFGSSKDSPPRPIISSEPIPIPSRKELNEDSSASSSLDDQQDLPRPPTSPQQVRPSYAERIFSNHKPHP